MTTKKGFLVVGRLVLYAILALVFVLLAILAAKTIGLSAGFFNSFSFFSDDDEQTSSTTAEISQARIHTQYQQPIQDFLALYEACQTTDQDDCICGTYDVRPIPEGNHLSFSQGPGQEGLVSLVENDNTIQQVEYEKRILLQRIATRTPTNSLAQFTFDPHIINNRHTLEGNVYFFKTTEGEIELLTKRGTETGQEAISRFSHSQDFCSSFESENDIYSLLHLSTYSQDLDLFAQENKEGAKIIFKLRELLSGSTGRVYVSIGGVEQSFLTALFSESELTNLLFNTPGTDEDDDDREQRREALFSHALESADSNKDGNLADETILISLRTNLIKRHTQDRDTITITYVEESTEAKRLAENIEQKLIEFYPSEPIPPLDITTNSIPFALTCSGLYSLLGCRSQATDSVNQPAIFIDFQDQLSNPKLYFGKEEEIAQKIYEGIQLYLEEDEIRTE